MSFQIKSEQILVWQNNGETVWIEPWGANTLRVRATMAPSPMDLPGMLLEPAPVTPTIVIEEDNAVISNGLMRGEISSNGGIRFLREDTGAILLEEPAPDFFLPPERTYKGLSSDLFHTEVRFKSHDDERLYGLGQYPHGYLNQKGCVLELKQVNNQVSIPFMLSSRGYGFVWHNPGIGRVELANSGTRWVAEATRQIDYLIMAGDSYAEIMTHYADAFGYPTMMPEWATGFWQCKLRYRNQEELLSVAREYKKRELPLSIIVIDFFHWTVQGEWRFDSENWPDPAAMVQELEEMGVQVMVSVWPTVNPLSENYNLMKHKGWLARTERGIPLHLDFQDNRPVEGPTNVQYYDATHPDARQFVWEQVREGYYKYGIKIWWLDACEPEIRPEHHENMRYYLGNGLEVANLYPVLHEQSFYEGLKAEGEEDVITLCRAGWLGSQRFAASIWSGDIDSTFESLQDQVRAGLNMALSGIPWWNTDIGGFKYGDIETDYFRELIVRWFQFGVFCPVTRLHGVREPFDLLGNPRGTGNDNEVWSFGETAYEILKDYLFLRERLRPYILDQMSVAHEKGHPVMRPLFFDFEDDSGCIAVDDQYMFGPEIMVAPVLSQGEEKRSVYLPAGVSWTDAWTGEVFEGGQSITAEAPLERIPIYLRGTDNPLQPFFVSGD
ncbi:TIM-barrel domain-containing protein [Chloroflexota bacterium]